MKITKHSKNIASNLLFFGDLSPLVENRLIIITGVARSGTTVFGKILSTFRDIEYDFEPLLMSQLPILVDEKMIDSRIAQEILQANFDELFINHVLGRGNMRPSDDSVETIQKTEEEIRKRWRLLKGRDDAKKYIKEHHLLFVVKTPDLFPFLDFIYKSFKGVKLIHVVRNAFDVAFSIEKKKWYSGNMENISSASLRRMVVVDSKKHFVPFWLPKEKIKQYLNYSNYERCLFCWIELMNLFFQFKDKTSIMNKDNYLEVKYEDILTNNKAIIKKIKNFIKKDSTKKTEKIFKKINADNLYKNKNLKLKISNKKNTVLAQRLMQRLGYCVEI